LGFYWFCITDIEPELDGRLQLMPAVPEYIRGHPHNPERDSDNKDH